ncbi:hypothetical protein EVAR_91326_1 [Eumeta japonica]|uniref:Uncharacterized protein n=1 Tax=Eumeta variegata TaxID=151549 RepID=A0A4C1TCP3_EUMVA|nr:hypothetical protein EVAR_91326_1 [Eumeta japonica]
MSAPRKKLSVAEYRKKAKYKVLQGKQCADNMKNWLRKGGNPSVSAATSEVDVELEDVPGILPVQMDQDFSQTDFTCKLYHLYRCAKSNLSNSKKQNQNSKDLNPRIQIRMNCKKPNLIRRTQAIGQGRKND